MAKINIIIGSMGGGKAVRTTVIASPSETEILFNEDAYRNLIRAFPVEPRSTFEEAVMRGGGTYDLHGDIMNAISGIVRLINDGASFKKLSLRLDRPKCSVFALRDTLIIGLSTRASAELRSMLSYSKNGIYERPRGDNIKELMSENPSLYAVGLGSPRLSSLLDLAGFLIEPGITPEDSLAKARTKYKK